LATAVFFAQSKQSTNLSLYEMVDLGKDGDKKTINQSGHQSRQPFTAR
jgi:hypothetical protein